MRRSTPFAALLCAVLVLGTAVAGFALANAAGSPGGTLAALANAVSASPSPAEFPTAPTPSAQAPMAQAPMVTVPALTAAAPPPPGEAAALDGGATEPAPAEPAPTPPAEVAAPPEPAAPQAEPVPPASAPDAPLVTPYSTVLGWHGDGKVAYLTFDDGPGPATGRVLDILAAGGIKATFCATGERAAQSPALLRRVVDEGHTLCNHSWDHHSSFDALRPAEMDAQIGRTQDAFRQATGVAARYFRAPEGRFGASGGAVLQAGQRARTIPLGWGVDSLDWNKPGTPAIVTNVLSNVSPGAVILLHDGGGTDRDQTLAALPEIISGLQAAGYALAAMPADPAG